MKNPIKFIKHKTKITPIVCPTSFEFRPEKGHKILQKICFWVLNKINAYHVDYRQDIETMIINPDSFMENVFTQLLNIKQEFNLKPTQMFIGGEDYQKIMGEKGINQYITFDAEYGFATKTSRRIIGLEVHIVPWMEGIILLP